MAETGHENLPRRVETPPTWEIGFGGRKPPPGGGVSAGAAARREAVGMLGAERRLELLRRGTEGGARLGLAPQNGQGARPRELADPDQARRLPGTGRLALQRDGALGIGERLLGAARGEAEPRAARQQHVQILRLLLRP